MILNSDLWIWAFALGFGFVMGLIIGMGIARDEY
jgi:hypothetical protein